MSTVPGVDLAPHSTHTAAQMNAPAGPAACLNCETPLAAGQRFCGACGQRVFAGRLTLPEIAHDVVHAFTHADRSIFSLFRALLLRPGLVARDYVEGRRKKYFGPFAFLVISVGLASFLTYLLGTDWFAAVPEGQSRAFLSRHFNLVILVQTPLLALGCWVLFRSARMNFAEHLVLAAYTSGMRALFLGLVETPMRILMDARQSSHWITAVYFAVWFAYFGYASVQFYGGHKLWAAARAVLSAALAVFLTSFLIFAFIYLMARFGGS